MSTQHRLDEELERRLTQIEGAEASDPAHASLGPRTLAGFLAVVVGIAAFAWIGAML